MPTWNAVPVSHISHLFRLCGEREGFPHSSVGRESTRNSPSRRHRTYEFNPWSRKMPWRRNGNPLQNSCLENSMGRGAWRATVQRFTKSWTRLSDWGREAGLMRNSFIDQVPFTDECRKKLPLKEHTPFLCSFNASVHSDIFLNKILKNLQRNESV